MRGCRPNLISDPSPTADAIHECLELLGRPADRYRFGDCRPHLEWHEPGLLLLVAAATDDWAAVTALVQECSLRHSLLTPVVIRAAGLSDSGAAEPVARLGAELINWPEDSGKLRDLVRSRRGAAGDESLAGRLSSRLMSLTPSLAAQAGRLAVAAAHDLTVLLTGETGTGKTYLARLLHDHSPRRDHPFLSIPCGAQPANLVESCFFGHVKGAFTGAHQAQKGKFAAAGRGTILLDEIDTLGLEQQAGLLRVIETGEYEPVGGHDTARCDARIIVASNWDLEQAIVEGQFRQDLYYRLNVFPFHLPPLRERPRDVAPLARGFAAQFCARFGKGLTDITPEAIAALEAYPWPGNIRQLENIVQQAVLVSGGPELTVADLPEAVRRPAPDQPRTVFVPASSAGPRPPLALRTGGPPGRPNSLLESRAEYERGLIEQTLADCKFNRSATARVLGISRVTLHKKIKQYGLTNVPAVQGR